MLRKKKQHKQDRKGFYYVKNNNYNFSLKYKERNTLSCTRRILFSL